MTRPATRCGDSRSCNHHQAITAANSGAAALKIADIPAVIDRAA